MYGTHTSSMPTGAPPTCASWQSKHPEHTDAQRHSVCRKARLQMAWAAEALPDGTPSAKGNTLMCHQGVDVQCKCTLIICYSTRIRYFDDTRDCAIAGLSADRYFFTLSLCMPVPGRSHEWTAPCAAPSVRFPSGRLWRRRLSAPRSRSFAKSFSAIAVGLVRDLFGIGYGVHPFSLYTSRNLHRHLCLQSCHICANSCRDCPAIARYRP